MMRRHAPLLFLPALVAAFPAAAREPSPALDPLPRLPATFAGRVFFTAAERRALDAKARAADVPTPSPPAAPPDPRRFDGALWREGRIVALWFDGDAVKPAGEPAVRLAGGMPGTTARGRPETLLPGQTWLPQGGGARP